MILSSPVHKCKKSGVLHTGVRIECLSLCQHCEETPVFLHHANEHLQLMFQYGIESPFETPVIGKGHMRIWIIMQQCFLRIRPHRLMNNMRQMMLSHCWLQTRKKIFVQYQKVQTHIERCVIERHEDLNNRGTEEERSWEEERLTGNVVYGDGQDQQNDSPPAASCLTAHFLCFRTHFMLLCVSSVGTPASLIHLSILNFI